MGWPTGWTGFASVATAWSPWLRRMRCELWRLNCWPMDEVSGMKQSRLMSLVESVANVIVGYGVAVVTQILIFPVFGLHTTLAQNLKMGAMFTVVSIARSFALRRVFEAIRMRSAK